MGRRIGCLALAVLLAGALTACSSTSDEGTAAAAACQKAATPSQPSAPADPQPGDVRWVVSLGHCVEYSGQEWQSVSPTVTASVVAAPGNRVVLFNNGVVSLYSETGTKLWQRNVAAPAADHTVSLDTMQASATMVMVTYAVYGGSSLLPTLLSTFLNLADGTPLGKMNATMPSRPFLVGSSVVMRAFENGAAAHAADINAVEGYDPITGKTLWRLQDANAPEAGQETDDGSVLYLDAGDGKINRVDAATGNFLSPLTLPAALKFDLEEGGNHYGQGLLLLRIRPCLGSAATCSVSETLAVDPATGRIKWTDQKEDIEATASGLFVEFGPEPGLTAIDPKNGKTVWTIDSIDAPLVNGLSPEPPLILNPDSAVVWSQAADKSAVIGVATDGHQLWTSADLATTVDAANTADTMYAVSCVPWDQAPRLCSSLTLRAIAIA